MFLLQGNTTLNADNIWVTIVTILFTLSLISERIANLIKLNTDDLSNKRFDLKGEKRREKGIMWIAVICGILTCTLAGADFFTLITNGTLINTLDIFNPDKKDVTGKAFLGFILSGFFVSMGSKFWHDVLDIVLQFSNLKKFKADESMTQAKVQLDLVNEATRMQLVQKTENFLPRLKAMEGFSGYDAVIKDQSVELQLKFLGEGPGSEDRKQIKEYYGEDTVTIQKLDTNAGLHGH